MPIRFDPDHPDANVHGLRYVEGPSSQWAPETESSRELDDAYESHAIIEQAYEPMNAQRPLGSGGTVSTEAEHQLQHLRAVVELGEAYAAEHYDLTRGAHSGGDAPRDPRTVAELEAALNTSGTLSTYEWGRRAGLRR